LVSLFVEFVEEEEEHNSMHANEPYKCTGIVAFSEQQLECMYHNHNKLDLRRELRGIISGNHTTKFQVLFKIQWGLNTIKVKRV
jgi:hypothetical protein